MEFARYGIIKVKPFDKEKIEEIIKVNLGIKNQHYLKRISEISNGNARIAMIAGITARRENALASLADVSKLYENYYGRVIEEYKLCDEKDLIITFGQPIKFCVNNNPSSNKRILDCGAIRLSDLPPCQLFIPVCGMLCAPCVNNILRTGNYILRDKSSGYSILKYYR